MPQGKDKNKTDAQLDKELDMLENEVSGADDDYDSELEALLNDNKKALDNAKKVTESVEMPDKDARNAYKQSAEEVKKTNKALNSMFSQYSPDKTVSKSDMDELEKEVAAEKNKKPARNIKPSEKKEPVRQGKKPATQELSHAQRRELQKQKLQAQYGKLNTAAKQYGEKQLKELGEMKKNADALQKKADAVKKQNAPKLVVEPQKTQKQLDAEKKQKEKELADAKAKEAKEKAAKEKAEKAKKAKEEAERKAEEKRKAAEEAKRKKEEDKRKAKEEADRKAEEKRKAAEETKRNKEIEKQKLNEQKLADAKKAQEDKEKKRQEELKKKEEAKRKAKEEADRKAEEKHKAAEDAKRNKEIEKQKLKEQKLADAKKAQEDKEKKRQEELKKKEEAKRKAKEEADRKAEEKHKAAEETKRNKEIEKQKLKEQKLADAKKAQEDKEKKRQEELKKKEEAKRKAKEEADRKAEEKRKADEEAKRKKEEAKREKEIAKQKAKETKKAPQKETPTAPKPAAKAPQKNAKAAEQMIEMADLSASSKAEPEKTQSAPEAPKAESKTNGRKSVSLEEEWKKEAEAKAAKEQENKRQQEEKERKAAEKAALKAQKAAEKKAIQQRKNAIKQAKKDAKTVEKNAKKAAQAEEKRQQKELIAQKRAEGRARRAQDKADSKNLLYMKPPKMPNLLTRMLNLPSARRFNQYSELLGMKPPSVLGTLLKGIGISALNIVGAVLGFKVRDRSNERFMEEFRARGNEFRQQNLRERAERQYQQFREKQMTPPQPRLQERQPMPNQLMQAFQNRQMQMMQRQFQAMARQIVEQQRQIETFTRQAQTPRMPEIPKAAQPQPQVQAPQAQAPQMQHPQPQAPQAQAPQMQRPQPQAPQAQAPQMQHPQPQAPQAQAPQMQRPQPQAPQAQAPQMQHPQPQAPQAQMPQMQRPQMTPAQVRLTGLQFEKAQMSKMNPQTTMQGLMATRGYGENFVQNPQFMKNLATFTAVSVINNGTPEDIKSFLKDPVGHTPKVQQMVAACQDQYVKNWTATQKDGDQLGHDFSFNDPKATSMAINKLAAVMNQEPNLGPAHVGAASVGKHLLDALTDPKTNALNADDGLNINAAQYVSNALPTMATVYRNGLEAEMSFLANPAKKENLGAVATKDAMNYVLDQNVQEGFRNRSMKNDQPTMAMQVMLSEQFNPQFLNAAMQSSNAAQTMVNSSAEEVTNMLTNPNARGKLGENVAKEGFTAGAKYVAQHRIKKDAEPKVETPQAEQPKVETSTPKEPKLETPKAEEPKAETVADPNARLTEAFLGKMEEYFGKENITDEVRANIANNIGKTNMAKMANEPAVDVDDELEPEVKEEPKPQEKVEPQEQKFDPATADQTIGKHQPKDKPFEDILKDFEKQNPQPQADPNQPQATVPDLSSTRSEKSMAELGDEMQRQMYEQNKQFREPKDTRSIDEQLDELNKQQAEQHIEPVEGPELSAEKPEAPGMQTLDPRDPDYQKKLDAYKASLEQPKAEEPKPEEAKPEATESSVQKNAVEADEKTLSSSLKQVEEGAAQKNEEDLRQKLADTVGKGNVTEEAQKNVSQLFEEKPQPQVETPKNEVKQEAPKPDTISKGTDAQVSKVEAKDNFKSVLDPADQLLDDMEKKFGADKITDQTRKNLQNLYENAQKGERDINNQLNSHSDLSANWKVSVNGRSVNSVLAYDNIAQQLKNGNADALKQLSTSGADELSTYMYSSQTAKSLSQDTHSPETFAATFRNKDMLHAISARAGEEIAAARLERNKNPNQISQKDATQPQTFRRETMKDIANQLGISTDQNSASTPNQKGADEFMKQVSDKFGAGNITPDMRSNLTKLFNDNASAHNNLDKALGKNGATAQLSGKDVSNMLAFNQIASRIEKGDKSVLNDMYQVGAANNLQKMMSGTNEAKYFSDRPMNPNSLDRAFNDPTQKEKMAQSSSAQIDNAFAKLTGKTSPEAQMNDPMLQSNMLEGAKMYGKLNYKPAGGLNIMAIPGADPKLAQQERMKLAQKTGAASGSRTLGRSGLNRVKGPNTLGKNNPNNQSNPQQQASR